MSETDIEQRGSEQELDFLDDVMLLHAKFTGGHIRASRFVEALRVLVEADADEVDIATAATP